MSDNNLAWSSKLHMAESQCKVWKNISFGCFIALVFLIISLGVSTYYYSSNSKTPRLLLVAPALGVGSVDVEGGADMTPNIIRTISKRIIELNEIWSYESIEDNFNELFEYYYDSKVAALTKNNLLSTDRFEYVKKHKIISTFKIDWKKSQFRWCSRLNRTCSLVIGKRRLFLNNNEPHKEKEVAYLIFSQAIFPTLDNPHAVRVKRIKIDDSSSDPYGNFYKQYKAALNGVLQDEK